MTLPRAVHPCLLMIICLLAPSLGLDPEQAMAQERAELRQPLETDIPEMNPWTREATPLLSASPAARPGPGLRGIYGGNPVGDEPPEGGEDGSGDGDRAWRWIWALVGPHF